ncbi:Ubiquitin thioesterase otubain-like [Raphanus sativus]|uniref:Ubiquitin thioesterase n=1 Tax=Raphanus sativus TaxID=3726 RepID=A0A6J0KKS7_RAPSA|nr:OVARIAN TUMOR DOMAIN-containing deubiquitinating enzyme 1 [Raphanus sativus]KAJ4870005.1 Ubiquitin thioesterase otubain-like [Raphanus sativus]
MQNQNDTVKDDAELAASISAMKGEEWGCCSVEEPSFQEDEAAKVPYVGDKEPLSSLSAEYQAGSPILLEKIKILDSQYVAIRRTRGDGNCFFRSFMFSYLEHVLESQDGAEVDRIKVNVEKCRKTLQNLGYTDFTFEDFFALFLEQLDDILQGSEESISYDELVNRSRDQSVSDYIVMFFRFVTAGEIRTRAEFFEPFITGLSNTTVDQFCKTSVEPMGEESDHIHITALSDALGVAIRVVYLDRSSCGDTGGVTVNHHDFVPVGTNDEKKEEEASAAPFITLLYRPGHYDILYPKVLDDVEK